MFFFGKKKLSLPPFTVGAFGKLPFYKDFLYSSFGSEFSQLKGFFDSGMEQLHRSGMKRPFVEPARNFYVKMDGFQNDLVGCAWDSNDGLRAFPFILAAPVPRKVRKEDFPMFWTVLSQYWGYLGELYSELSGMTSTTDFYQLVKGSKHLLNSPDPPQWETTSSTLALSAGLQLNDGFLAHISLTGIDEAQEDTFLKALHLKHNPAMILWPRGPWKELPQVHGYMGTMGFDEMCISYFPPESTLESKPEIEPEQVPEQISEHEGEAEAVKVTVESVEEETKTDIINTTSTEESLDEDTKANRTIEPDPEDSLDDGGKADLPIGTTHDTSLEADTLIDSVKDIRERDAEEDSNEITTKIVPLRKIHTEPPPKEDTVEEEEHS